jgi:hypothetical protein
MLVVEREEPMRSTLLMLALALALGCSSEKPAPDASPPADTGTPDSGSNCVPRGGSCKSDAGDFQVALCCSGQCELGSVATGTCD